MEQTLNSTAGPRWTLELSVAVYLDGCDHTTVGPASETPQGTLSVDEREVATSRKHRCVATAARVQCRLDRRFARADEMEHLEACAVAIRKSHEASARRQNRLMVALPSFMETSRCLSGTEIPEIADGHTKGIDR